MQFGKCKTNKMSLTVSTGAYTSGDCVGGIITAGKLDSPTNRGVLKNVCVVDKDNQKPALTILLMRSLPTGTYTDNGAFALADADEAKVIGKVNIAAADYETIGSKAVADVEVSKLIEAYSNNDKSDPANRDLHFLILTTTAPDFTATTSLTIYANILSD